MARIIARSSVAWWLAMLSEGKLTRVFGLERGIPVKAHFVVYPARHAKRPPVAAFLEWLRRNCPGMKSLAQSR